MITWMKYITYYSFDLSLESVCNFSFLTWLSNVLNFEIWYPNQQKHDLLLLMFFFSRFPVVGSTVNYVNQPKCLQSLWWTRCFYSTRAGKVESLRLPVVVRPLQTPPTFQWGCQIHPPQTQLIQLKQPWIIVPTPRQVCFIIRRNA